MKRLVLILSLVLTAACTKSWQPEGEELLVIEGWIDEGKYPVVMVTTSVPTETEYQAIDDQKKHLGRWARVEVSDGETSILLTGMTDKNYFPSYLYTCTGVSGYIKGVAGKTYTLTVDLNGHHATASTTVPAAVPLDKLEAVPSADNPGKYRLEATFGNPAGAGRYYRLFIKTEGADDSYVPSFMGCLEGDNLADPATIEIMKGQSVQNDSGWEWNPALYDYGEKVHVKFCTMDRVSFDFWNSFEKIAALSRVPFFPVTYNPPYNVAGGIGCWCGYGASEYSIEIK